MIRARRKARDFEAEARRRELRAEYAADIGPRASIGRDADESRSGARGGERPDVQRRDASARCRGGVERPARDDERLPHDGAVAGKVDVHDRVRRASARKDAVNAAVEAAEVQLARRIDAKRRDVANRRRAAEFGRVLDEV